MIILFTANLEGGILQFSLELLKTLIKKRIEVCLFVPKACKLPLHFSLNEYLFFYEKKNFLLTNNPNNKKIVRNMLELNPKLIWFMEDSILSSQLLLLCPKHIKTIMTYHDALGYHPSNTSTIRTKIHNRINSFYSKKSAKKASYILFLSDYTKNVFSKKHPKYLNKVLQMNLGAHIETALEEKPNELSSFAENYILFFGRIDKYKGIAKFLNIFSKYKNENGLFLIIAGKGSFSESEKNSISQLKNVIVINRYISDEEMLFLFKNSKALILPYIEATQSGIIPIAYKLGKPVIVSDVPGLTQFVEHGKTGFVCKNDNDYINAIESIITCSDNLFFEHKTMEYYNSFLEFDINVGKILNLISLDVNNDE